MNTTRLAQILTTGDKIVIAVLLSISLAGFPLLSRVGKTGNTVQIEVNGTHSALLSLAENQTLAVPGPLGETLLTIHDGHVHVTESPCRNKICIHSGRISRSGEIIACVPNKVVIQILGDKTADYDAVTQ
ncbi:hypothetical protein CSB45_04450 [candidate division KSB3 bacterium]|uniref:Uncharacterized protein n=1 Tax=candidate division KSB3 bacterium TaxID=2044937 RepID=A0A2G6E8A7_9BACT|nr:MAG: hypothetical protein CSB45_04450 [candidate division KSB3 bacterium]PIE30628.1 MAG: hypothetical protein CSA57_03035 [candidate division KSB3 bacterium]